MRQRLGKRPYSSERQHSTSPVASRDSSPPREPITDVHRRLGVVKQDTRGLYPDSSKDRKSSRLWSRLGPSSHKGGVPERKPSSRRAGSGSASSRLGGREGEEENEEEEEDDSALQKVWGALIKQKERQTHKMKKSRLDNLPSLQIEISRESSNGSDSDS